MTRKLYNKMLRVQLGRCAICNHLPRRRRLAVDHNHLTMQVRALLCHRCNMLLGSAEESPDLLLNAVKYLLKYETQKGP